ncbi:hypothetical protein QUB19_02250 [Microcoleus sp. B4-C5]|uniref:hypothetical protein n=1 Tax=unclassified Microcoleus TaxID=2642155 RepID=UPI002FD41C31
MPNRASHKDQHLDRAHFEPPQGNSLGDNNARSRLALPDEPPGLVRSKVQNWQESAELRNA